MTDETTTTTDTIDDTYTAMNTLEVQMLNEVKAKLVTFATDITTIVGTTSSNTTIARQYFNRLQQVISMTMNTDLASVMTSYGITATPAA